MVEIAPCFIDEISVPNNKLMNLRQKAMEKSTLDKHFDKLTIEQEKICAFNVHLSAYFSLILCAKIGEKYLKLGKNRIINRLKCIQYTQRSAHIYQ